MNDFWKNFIQGIISVFTITLFKKPKRRVASEMDIFKRVYSDINNALEKFSNDKKRS
jgi:hypothetical protein